MNFRVLGSTKVGYNLPIRDAKIFAGKEAHIGSPLGEKDGIIPSLAG